jgi:hypothetical protein
VNADLRQSRQEWYSVHKHAPARDRSRSQTLSATLNQFVLVIVCRYRAVVLEKINQLVGRARADHVLGSRCVNGDEAAGSPLGCVQ